MDFFFLFANFVNLIILKYEHIGRWDIDIAYPHSNIYCPLKISLKKTSYSMLIVHDNIERLILCSSSSKKNYHFSLNDVLFEMSDWRVDSFSSTLIVLCLVVVVVVVFFSILFVVQRITYCYMSLLNVQIFQLQHTMKLYFRDKFITYEHVTI